MWLMSTPVPLALTTLRPAWRRLLPVLLIVAVAWFGVHWLFARRGSPASDRGTSPGITNDDFCR